MINKETTTESIIKTVEILERKVAEQAALIKYYEELLRLNKHKKYGSSSEKTVPGQKNLAIFDETENEAGKIISEPAVEQITYARRKREGKREDDLSKLPVEQVVHSLSEEERKCPECGGPLHVMGQSEPRREIEIVPAQVKVIEHVREVYACRNCERNSTSVPVVKAPQPEPVIKGSAASPSSVAHIMTQKYMNAVPLYRQEVDLLTNGLLLSRQTMANWMIRSSERWLEPLYGMMKSKMLEEEVLHADETTLQVLREPGRAARKESFMWLYRTSGCADVPVILYEYQETRSSSHSKRFLEKFKGYLHTDGYAGYHKLPNEITVVGCWAHARRKFDDAVKSAPPDGREGLPSQKGFDFCNRLFGLEREYEREKLKYDERRKARIERSKPVSDALFEWASSAGALPKSLLGKAVHYLMEQRPYLENVYRDGRLELSNNRAERSIRPFVIGRRNWLFSATPKGAKASAVIYSVMRTAKANDLKPFEYLKHVFGTMPNIGPEKYGSLLPWSDSLPERCKLTSREKE
jgi:transposase